MYYCITVNLGMTISACTSCDKKIKETSSESLESLEAQLSAKSSKVHSDFVRKVPGIGHFAESLLPAPVESEISPRQ